MSDGYAILSLDKVETAPHALGFRAARVDAWKADTGGQLMPPHEENSGNEELYAVVRGRARFTVGEEEAEAPAGTLVFVPPGVHREATAAAPDTTVVVVGGRPGDGLPVSPFEYWYAAGPALFVTVR